MKHIEIEDKRRTFFDKMFKDRTGHIALSATPNVPIAVWFIALLLTYVFPGRPGHVFGTISHGALFVWAWLELFQGVNYFRRLLGAIVLVYIVVSTR